MSMDMDDYLPKRADDPLNLLIRQDLAPLSVDELRARVAALEAEIARVRRTIDQAVSHKASAEALFRK